MAFQSMIHYNEANFGNRFRLANDGDAEDVIFLYQKIEDVLIGDVHYLKYPEYSGYVHCIGANCPACKAKVRLQRKLFIPVYVISQNKVVFWDRNTTFENQLQRDIFSRHSDPSKVVFRITRKGGYKDINTTYSITAIGTNNVMSYEDICKKFNITMPAYYEDICADKSYAELESIIGGSSNNSNVPDSSLDYSLPEYQVSPRGTLNDSDSNLIGSELPATTNASSVTMSDNVSGADSDDDIPF